MGIILSGVMLFIIYQLWINANVELKWKIILTSSAVIGKFFLYGIPTLLVMIVIILVLRWHGVKIR